MATEKNWGCAKSHREICNAYCIGGVSKGK